MNNELGTAVKLALTREALVEIERNRDGHDPVECITYQCPACIAREALARLDHDTEENT